MWNYIENKTSSQQLLWIFELRRAMSIHFVINDYEIYFIMYQDAFVFGTPPSGDKIQANQIQLTRRFG